MDVPSIFLVPIYIIGAVFSIISPFIVWLGIGLTIHDIAEQAFFKEGKKVLYWLTTIAGWYFATIGGTLTFLLVFKVAEVLGF